MSVNSTKISARTHLHNKFALSVNLQQCIENCSVNCCVSTHYNCIHLFCAAYAGKSINIFYKNVESLWSAHDFRSGIKQEKGLGVNTQTA